MTDELKFVTLTHTLTHQHSTLQSYNILVFEIEGWDGVPGRGGNTTHCTVTTSST